MTEVAESLQQGIPKMGYCCWQDRPCLRPECSAPAAQWARRVGGRPWGSASAEVWGAATCPRAGKGPQGISCGHMPIERC